MDKIDKIAEDINEIKIVLAVNTEQLKEHIRRTALLELDVKLREEGIQAQLNPISEHVTQVKTIIKVIAWIGASGLVSALGYFVKYLNLL